MNGFNLFSEDYKKLLQLGQLPKEEALRQIRIYDFLGDCAQEDLYSLVDSSAFNDVMKAYLAEALKRAKTEAKTAERIRQEFSFLLEEKTAKEITESNSWM